MKSEKICSIKQCLDQIHDGASIFIGGYMGENSAKNLIHALAESDKGGFTILCNDGGRKIGPDGSMYFGVAELIHSGKVKKLIATHVGLNPEVSELVNEGKLKLVLLPQGSFAEMIRAGGAGLGGILTPAGVGTLVEENEFALKKELIDGKEYLLMKSLKADIAILNSFMSDTVGNLWFRGNSKTFQNVMATAAKTVIVETEQIVPLQTIAAENIAVPGVFVDYILDRSGL